MRRKFNLDLTELDRFTILVYGAYGVGKTAFVGDCLRTLSAQGPVRFLNMKGEDGHLTLRGAGLGEIGETIENTKDYDAAIEEYTKQGLTALGVDSLPAWETLVLRDVVGAERFPDAKLDGERAKALWGQIKKRTEAGVTAARQAAKYVIWSAPYDRTEDPFGGGSKFLSPNLIGKSAVASIGWFDFVAVMQATTMGAGKVRRWLSLAPRNDALTRQRLPQPITADIDIPEGPGGWTRLFEAIQGAMTPQEGKK